MNCKLFFQAEDGIRDPEMSRGLGDVYTRLTLFDTCPYNRKKNMLLLDVKSLQ